jgi:hypothetical protein
MFAAIELEQPLWRISRHTALYPEHLRLPAEVTRLPSWTGSKAETQA